MWARAPACTMTKSRPSSSTNRRPETFFLFFHVFFYRYCRRFLYNEIETMPSKVVKKPTQSFWRCYLHRERYHARGRSICFPFCPSCSFAAAVVQVGRVCRHTVGLVSAATDAFKDPTRCLQVFTVLPQHCFYPFFRGFFCSSPAPDELLLFT